MKYYVVIFLFFSIYSFLGWVLETASVSIEKGRFVNRGFLTGCFCPVYGFGAVMIINVSTWISTYVRDHFEFVFINMILAIFLITALEYVTGLILNNIFDRKWWDYSNEFANIKGYVCLRNSVIWGVLALLVIQVVHPLIYKIVLSTPSRINYVFTLILVAFLMLDTIKSTIATLDLDIRFRDSIKIRNDKLDKLRIVLRSRL